MTPPLEGVRVIELAGQGPGPFGCMLLADLGAEVVTVERIGAPRPTRDAHHRGRSSICINVKDERGRDLVLDLVSGADVLVEGYRPGVAERLGLGPDPCRSRNPRLVYARMTGWGQEGPLAQVAGHDINYLALSGALSAIGERGGAPVPPLNLVGDYGGGGMLLAIGVLAALRARDRTGTGQVVDAAMVDGVALMLAPFLALSSSSRWSAERGSNYLDGGAPFYGTYRTADDEWLAVGAIEAPFYAAFLDGLGIDPAELGPQMEPSAWPAARARIAETIAGQSREHWLLVFADREACVQPVLRLDEAPLHEHAAARRAYSVVAGATHPSPAPRFGSTPLTAGRPPVEPGADTVAVLEALGLGVGVVQGLRRDGVVA